MIKDKLKAAHTNSIPEIVKKELIPWLMKIKDPLRRDYLITQIASLTGISKQSIGAYLQPGSPIQPKQRPRDPAPVIEMDQSKIEALSPIAYEFFAHLYFATPEEVDQEEASTFINQRLQHSSAWVNFALELISCLNSNHSPDSQEILSWPSTQPQTVAQFINSIKQKRKAFETTDRKIADKNTHCTTI